MARSLQIHLTGDRLEPRPTDERRASVDVSESTRLVARFDGERTSFAVEGHGTDDDLMFLTVDNDSTEHVPRVCWVCYPSNGGMKCYRINCKDAPPPL